MLAGATVTIVADQDSAGLKHAETVASSLDGIAAEVMILHPAAGNDISDHLAAGRTLAEPPAATRSPTGLTDLLVSDILAKNPERTEEELEGVDSLNPLMELMSKDSVATEIVNLVKKAGAQLWHDKEKTAFATFTLDGHRETWPIRSRAFEALFPDAHRQMVSICIQPSGAGGERYESTG